MVKYVVGHKNPDSDSVCAAIAYSYLMNKEGKDALAVIQGELTPETEFILTKFGVDKPDLMTDAKDKEIILVDHSDINQAPDNIMDAKEIFAIIDHHKLGDITTTKPLEMWVWPVGCTCTIIKAIYDYNNIEIPKDIAGLMLSAILSDTVIFKSPTCTKKDIETAEELAKLLEINDIHGLGMEIFKAKSAIEGVLPRNLIMRDYKDFKMTGKNIGIGQLEVVDIFMFEEIKEDLLDQLKEMVSEGRDAVFLFLTDIIKEGSEVLYASNLGADVDIIKEAFGTPSKDNSAWLAGIMSRKKQIVPNLENFFSKK